MGQSEEGWIKEQFTNLGTPRRDVVVPQANDSGPQPWGLKRQEQSPEPKRTDGWRWPQTGAVAFSSRGPKEAGEARGMNPPVSLSSNPSLGTPNHRSQMASPYESASRDRERVENGAEWIWGGQAS